MATKSQIKGFECEALFSLVEMRCYNGMINDIENIMLACMLKRHPKTRRMHKYTLISETVFKPKQKRIAKRYSIQKYHVELIPDANGKRKKKRVKDDAVTGGLSALMKYMADELKGYGG